MGGNYHLVKRMSHFKKLFPRRAHVIGMIHVKTHLDNRNSLNLIIEKACKEIEIYKECGIESILVENMHDAPYIQPSIMGPEVTATMTRICTEVRKILPRHMNCGVQILAGANKEAIAVAQASGLQFIRAEGYLYSQISDEGLMNSCAGELFRYRRNVRSDDILIFTDIKKKHCSHAITSDINIEETAKAAEFFLSDGVVITGNYTGDPTSLEDFIKVRKSCNLPVLIGSGVNANNIVNYKDADALIIGSAFKKDARWENEVVKERVNNVLQALRKSREEILQP